MRDTAPHRGADADDNDDDDDEGGLRFVILADQLNFSRSAVQQLMVESRNEHGPLSGTGGHTKPLPDR